MVFFLKVILLLMVLMSKFKMRLKVHDVYVDAKVVLVNDDVDENVKVIVESEAV